MGSLMHYSAIATKIRAMESRLLDEKDFEKLAAMENIPQAVAYLSQIPAYKAVLGGRDTASLHRGDMERLMIGTLYYDFSKLYRFSHRKQREILKLYFRKYEMAVIKRALRRIFNHGDRTGETSALRDALQKFSDIHMDEMAAAATIPELMEALRETEYRSVFAKLERAEQAGLFDYEMALDLYYFTEVWKQKGKFLKGKELQMLTRTFGSRIDLLNMMWIYRAKKYYQLPVASIYTLVIPVTYRLRDDEIRAMVTASDQRGLDEAIHHTYYGKRSLDMDADELEVFYYQFLNRIYVEEKRRNPYSMAAITAYLYDKEEEIHKLTTVLEGVRYGLPPKETLAYVGQ